MNSLACEIDGHWSSPAGQQGCSMRGWSVAAASQLPGSASEPASSGSPASKPEGPQGLADRSSRPRRCPLALTPPEQRQLEELRRQRWPLWRIAQQARRGMGTVSRYMKRLGLSRLKLLQPPEPVVRYERATPGELLHLDTKTRPHRRVGHRITGDCTLNRNRGIGWDMVHLQPSTTTRACPAPIKTDERARTVQIPARGGGVLRRPGRTHRPRHDRQR